MNVESIVSHAVPPRVRSWYVVPVLLLALAYHTEVRAQATHPEGRLHSVQINRDRIFNTAGDKSAFAPGLINKLHVVTREAVIRRQIWLQPGDWVSHADLRELERNLRALDLFSDVTVTTRAVPDAPGTVVLLVNTRDRLSIVFSGGGSFLGGVGEVRFSVGERNLLGLGHRLTFGYAENSSGELLGSLSYDNVLLSGNDTFGAVRLGRTEEGDFAKLELENRFLNFSDSNAWSLDITNDATRLDYYEQGESVAEVPRVSNRVEWLMQRRVGDNNRYWRFGPSLTYRDIEYGQATGVNAPTIDVPDDTSGVFAGGLLAYDHFTAFRKLSWIDTLSFAQDLSLGSGVAVLAGLDYERSTRNAELQPFIALDLWSRKALAQHDYISSRIETFASGKSGEFSAWSVSASAGWFNTRLANHTIALQLAYRSAGNDESGLPPEQSLGEDNGLRGYPAREFNGEQRVLLNFEDRIRTAVNVASFELGLVAFFDAGWVSDRGQDLRDAHTSAGVGLRIGSRPLLGRSVIRLDVAYPFDTDAERDYQPTVSLALGQVFSMSP